ncbi:hypothetical protein HaLaN_14058 [Haematococcus lacustris]|uniref:Uncharacterized protein n=1 Tax=Haematococcus lacustris TaxID=44745 RepID=A0A699ZNI5_HAELA|nr:hypothetical protein HaLaN_14058 [Haematococcus lacustris]
MQQLQQEQPVPSAVLPASPVHKLSATQRGVDQPGLGISWQGFMSGGLSGGASVSPLAPTTLGALQCHTGAYVHRTLQWLVGMVCLAGGTCLAAVVMWTLCNVQPHSFKVLQCLKCLKACPTVSQPQGRSVSHVLQCLKSQGLSNSLTVPRWTPTPGSGAMERGGVGVRKSADSNSARSPLERGPKNTRMLHLG